MSMQLQRHLKKPFNGLDQGISVVRGKVGQAVSVLLQHRHHFLYQPFLFFVAGNGYLAVLDHVDPSIIVER